NESLRPGRTMAQGAIVRLHAVRLLRARAKDCAGPEFWCYILRMLRTVLATRYVTPLREGGSLPAVMEADDDGLYVVKLRGAGQGIRALIAELIAGELGRAAGLR